MIFCWRTYTAARRKQPVLCDGRLLLARLAFWRQLSRHVLMGLDDVEIALSLSGFGGGVEGRSLSFSGDYDWVRRASL